MIKGKLWHIAKFKYFWRVVYGPVGFRVKGLDEVLIDSEQIMRNLLNLEQEYKLIRTFIEWEEIRSGFKTVGVIEKELDRKNLYVRR